MTLPIGDTLHVYASFASGVDYTVRLKVRMRDAVDGGILEELTANAIPYELRRVAPNDVPVFAEP